MSWSKGMNPVVCDYPIEMVSGDNNTFILDIYEDGSIYLINTHAKKSEDISLQHLRDLKSTINNYLMVLDVDEVGEDEIPF